MRHSTTTNTGAPLRVCYACSRRREIATTAPTLNSSWTDHMPLVSLREFGGSRSRPSGLRSATALSPHGRTGRPSLIRPKNCAASRRQAHRRVRPLAPDSRVDDLHGTFGRVLSGREGLGDDEGRLAPCRAVARLRPRCEKSAALGVLVGDAGTGKRPSSACSTKRVCARAGRFAKLRPRTYSRPEVYRRAGRPRAGRSSAILRAAAGLIIPNFTKFSGRPEPYSPTGVLEDRPSIERGLKSSANELVGYENLIRRKASFAARCRTVRVAPLTTRDAGIAVVGPPPRGAGAGGAERAENPTNAE